VEPSICAFLFSGEKEAGVRKTSYDLLPAPASNINTFLPLDTCRQIQIRIAFLESGIRQQFTDLPRLLLLPPSSTLFFLFTSLPFLLLTLSFTGVSHGSSSPVILSLLLLCQYSSTTTSVFLFNPCNPHRSLNRSIPLIVSDIAPASQDA